jgi:methylmalonyl-CoA carboxyltransferase large subunit
MPRTTVAELAELMGQLRAELAAMSRRMEALEGQNVAPAPQAAAPAAAPAVAPAPPPAVVSEEELLAISAAIAAFMGVRAHIRQIRLIGSGAWSQQGRVSIQASHRLD